MTPAAERIGFRLLCMLLAGRSAFRLVLYLANIVLLAAWGHRAFQGYAAASGGLIWLTALAQSGPEKAALKLIPRARRARGPMVSGLLGAVRVVPLVAGGVAAAALIADHSSTAALSLAMAAESIAIGANLVAVSVQRALGHARRDTVNFTLLSFGWTIITVLTIAGHVEPAVYVFGQFLLSFAVTEITMSGQEVRVRALIEHPRVLRVLAPTVLLMGVYDVVAYAATSGVFVVLAFTHFGHQSGDLYVAVAGWGMVAGFFTYLLRVFQPRVSLRLARGGQSAGQHRARSFARLAVAANAAWLLAAASLIVATGIASRPEGLPMIVALVALLASHTPAMMLTGAGIYLLENADGRSLRVAAGGAATGLAFVVIASAIVIPQYGAAGAVWALATGDLAQAAMLLRRGAIARARPATSRAEHRGSMPVAAAHG